MKKITKILSVLLVSMLVTISGSPVSADDGEPSNDISTKSTQTDRTAEQTDRTVAQNEKSAEKQDNNADKSEHRENKESKSENPGEDEKNDKDDSLENETSRSENSENNDADPEKETPVTAGNENENSSAANTRNDAENQKKEKSDKKRNGKIGVRAYTSSETSKVNNYTDMVDGSFLPRKFSFSSDDGKVVINILHITVKNKRSTATLRIRGETWDKIDANAQIYSGKIKNVLKRGSSETETVTEYEIPVRINSGNEIMAIASSGEAQPEKYAKSRVNLYPSLKSGKKLPDGRYRVKSDTDRIMFNMAPRNAKVHYSILTVKKGKMFADITLNGKGYDYLYAGPAQEAESVGKGSWHKGIKRDRYYTYRVPVALLDTNVMISAHSKKYGKLNKKSGKAEHQEWFQHTAIFYSKGAKKIKKATGAITGVKNLYPKKSTKKKSGNYLGKIKLRKSKNKKNKDSILKKRLKNSIKRGSGKNETTAPVDNRTSLKNGVYKPDGFGWSGGSGRLAYIRCSKISVTGGRAYATIVFGSSYYDALKAGGRSFTKQGGGESTFTIPVKLNANNTIIGRTRRMSQPHWIRYAIYIRKSESKKSNSVSSSKSGDKNKKHEKSKNDKKKTGSRNFGIYGKVPEIEGLTYLSETRIKYAVNFRILNYTGGVRLLSIYTGEGTYPPNDSSKMKTGDTGSTKDKSIYDDDGKKVVKSDHEITESLYRSRVINYLLVPKKYNLPAGLEKKYIIVRTPSAKAYVTSRAAAIFMNKAKVTHAINLTGIDFSDKSIPGALRKSYAAGTIKRAGGLRAPDYKKIIPNKIDAVLLPASVLPDKNSKDKTAALKDLHRLQRRFTALGIPVIIDRSDKEKTKNARAEWIKVYRAVFGESK